MNKRVIIVGTSSSGKSTLAKALAEKYNIPHEELDAFNWEANWTEATPENFRKRLMEFASQESWVLDGNYGKHRNIHWPKATDIIWLDYPLPTILKRFFYRSFRRSFTREELWNGNKESLWNSMLRPDSLFMWILSTYKKYRKEYSALMNSPEISHANFVRLKTPKETDKFVTEF